MSTDLSHRARRTATTTSDAIVCPFTLEIEAIPRFLNAELADHPVYDGLELQWFDDDRHGTGMLAFLSRREDRRVDYYVQPGLVLDRESYELGGGTGVWVETDLSDARLEVHPDGVVADVRFRDVDGRDVEVVVDDRDGTPRRRGRLLAPVGSGIDNPASLLLVLVHGFDLVRRTGRGATIRIDGEPVDVGRLPGRRWHRRELVKYGAPLTTVLCNRTVDGPVRVVDRDDPGDAVLAGYGDALAGLAVEAAGGRRARLALTPPLPTLGDLAPGVPEEGTWRLDVDDVEGLTGGTWRAVRDGTEVALTWTVTKRWDPGRQPWLIAMVTRVVPVVRRWPTTYRWDATVRLCSPPTITGRWTRVGSERGEGYRRATGSAG